MISVKHQLNLLNCRAKFYLKIILILYFALSQLIFNLGPWFYIFQWKFLMKNFATWIKISFHAQFRKTGYRSWVILKLFYGVLLKADLKFVYFDSISSPNFSLMFKPCRWLSIRNSNKKVIKFTEWPDENETETFSGTVTIFFTNTARCEFQAGTFYAVFSNSPFLTSNQDENHPEIFQRQRVSDKISLKAL